MLNNIILNDRNAENNLIHVQGGNKLLGKVSPDGAKNSALIHLSAACLVTDGWISVSNLPLISDVYKQLNILEEVGMKYRMKNGKVDIHSNVTNPFISSKHASKIRASITFLGSIIPKLGEVSLPLPGGDNIGKRPIDIHLDILKAFGIKTNISECMIHAKAESLPLKAASIFLRYPSVLSTVNAIFLGVLAEGNTVINNAAKEPEIVDLVSLLSKMGAKISGAGTSTISIHGVESLHSAEHEIIPDRLETGALLTAFVITGGQGVIENTIPEHNTPLIHILKNSGAEIEVENDRIYIKGSKLNAPINIEAIPYPGLATDLQPTLTALSLICPEGSVIKDSVFPERFAHVEEFRRMGANIERQGNSLYVKNRNELIGAIVEGKDIRSVVSLICAGLVANGETRIKGLEHLMRGHVNFINKLKSLNANIDIL